MANPFDLLPPKLFNLFSTQGYISLQRHNMTIPLRNYELAEFNRFGLAREIVIAEIVDYLKGTGVEAEVAAEMATNKSVIAEAAHFAAETISQKSVFPF